MKKQKTIHVAEKFWGYCSSDSVIDIKSKDGRTLYYFENDGRFPIKFNLPRGTWFTDNKVSRLPRPLEYICPEIPKPELNRNVKPMQFRAGNNPHKCSIDFQGKSFVDVFVDHEINKQARALLAEIRGQEFTQNICAALRHRLHEFLEDRRKCFRVIKEREENYWSAVSY